MTKATIHTKNNVEMAYFTFGTGDRSMVILPGIDVKSILNAAKAVESAYRIFADEYTIYVFDRRNNVPDHYSIRQMADDTAEVMRELGIFSADVFGASQGGMIALYLAAYYPDLVHAMVLGSTSAYANKQITSTAKRWIDYAKARNVTGLTADFVDHLYSDDTVKKYRDYLIHMNDSVSDDDLDRFIILAESIFGYDARPETERIDCPVLVIGAENDLAVGKDAVYEIAHLLGCELFVYGKEYAHCVFDEAPDYKERILDFFRKHR